MGKVHIMCGGGNNAGSDECTAIKDKVLAGYKAVTKDSDDDAVSGTMPNRGAVTQALNAGGSYTIPAGYHNGSGKVTANALAGQTAGTATARDMIVGKSAWVNGSKMTGTMPNQNNANNNGSARLLVEDGKVKMYPKAGYYGGYTANGPYYVWDTQALVAERGGLTATKILKGQSAFGLSGTATSDANATGANILSGKTAWINGAKVTGAMANQGAKTAALNAGGSYTIPAGYHNGSGKVTANSLASQTSATAAAANILSGKTAWVSGKKITGTIPSQGAKTVTPESTDQTIALSGKYMTGNIIVKGYGAEAYHVATISISGFSTKANTWSDSYAIRDLPNNWNSATDALVFGFCRINSSTFATIYGHGYMYMSLGALLETDGAPCYFSGNDNYRVYTRINADGTVQFKTPRALGIIPDFKILFPLSVVI